MRRRLNIEIHAMLYMRFLLLPPTPKVMAVMFVARVGRHNI